MIVFKGRFGVRSNALRSKESKEVIERSAFGCSVMFSVKSESEHEQKCQKHLESEKSCEKSAKIFWKSCPFQSLRSLLRLLCCLCCRLPQVAIRNVHVTYAFRFPKSTTTQAVAISLSRIEMKQTTHLSSSCSFKSVKGRSC